MSIEAQGLTVDRLKRTVLRDVSLRIRDGECVSIIGPNGAGKSTLMSALLGLLPTRGEVRLDGQPIASLSRRKIARIVAYVQQTHDGYTGFRVRDIVESGRYPHVDPLEPLSDADRRAVTGAIEATGIADLLDRTLDTLSGGERQKVWLAAALAQETPVLFLDEPTSALDPAYQVELIHIMRAYSQAGKTLVVICHDLNLPLALGGRVVALRGGSVFLDEPVLALEDTSRLRDLYGTEFMRHHGADGSVSIHIRV